MSPAIETSQTAKRFEKKPNLQDQNPFRDVFLAKLGNEKCAKIFFAQTFWTPPKVRDIPTKFPGHPRFLYSKPKEDKLSREGTNFSATTPSLGRPPPHRAVSGPKKLIFVLISLLPEKTVRYRMPLEMLWTQSRHSSLFDSKVWQVEQSPSKKARNLENWCHSKHSKNVFDDFWRFLPCAEIVEKCRTLSWHFYDDCWCFFWLYCTMLKFYGFLRFSAPSFHSLILRFYQGKTSNLPRIFSHSWTHKSLENTEKKTKITKENPCSKLT